MSTFSNWLKSNALSIAVPIGSGIIALIVAYGSFQKDNALLLNRIDIIEQRLKIHEQEIEELDDDIDSLETELKNEIVNIEKEMLRMAK